MTTSSVDPSAEIDAVKARLDALSATTYDGITPTTDLELDGHGKKAPYRDFEPGSVVPAGSGRMVAANEQQQPHIWSFQVHNFGSTRKLSRDLSIETDRTLLGWAPTANASVISTFFFNMYDERANNGEVVGWITTRFYECTLGVSPDMSLEIA